MCVSTWSFYFLMIGLTWAPGQELLPVSLDEGSCTHLPGHRLQVDPEQVNPGPGEDGLPTHTVVSWGHRNFLSGQ